jgi:hypothetical protein
MTAEEHIEIPAWIRSEFPADRRAAVDYLRRLIDEEMLREIAAADYGDRVQEHYAAIEPIWSDGTLARLGTWFPMEVLELIRWSEPEDPDWKPGSTGLRGHKMRAFSCAVLLATPNFDPDKATLIQMLDSVFAIGNEAPEAMGRFLTWRIGAIERGQDRPFFALALAAIAYLGDPEVDIDREDELAAWVAAEEAAERAYLSGFDPSYETAPWLFGLSFGDMRNARWRALIEGIQAASGEGPLGRLLARLDET